jgi:hypothetical protein
MKKIYYEFDTKKISQYLNIPNTETIKEEFFGSSGCDGVLNGFYGKKHTEITKSILKNSTLNLCKDENFLNSRRNFGHHNGMYNSQRFGELNPMYGKKHSEKSKKKQSEKRKEWFKNNESPLKGKPCLENTKKAIAEKNSKEYKLISPEGKDIKIKNLAKFCKENNLNENCIRHVIAGRNKSHKGWIKNVL